MREIRCVACGLNYPNQGVPYRCPQCGGLFDFSGPPIFIPPHPSEKLTGLWRYHESFSLAKTAAQITLGEGATPLVWDILDGRSIALKMESLNPTGSYKDRGSALLLSHLVQRGVTLAVEDSSGNAGASFAAYAARAGIRSRVYVPESASGPKRNQIEFYGAELRRIPGPRSAAAQAVLEDAQQGIPYASHAYLPFGLEGIATIAYELWESLQGSVPGTVIAPVGHGGLLLGLLRGFQALQAAGCSPTIPYLVGVQAAACDPVVRGFNDGQAAMAAAREDSTLAEGVRVRHPVRAEALFNEISPDSGCFIAIPEELIYPAFVECGRHGHYVEPTSAIVWAALHMLKEKKLPEPIVVVLSGFGLKYNPV